MNRRKWVTGLALACLLALGACRSGLAQSSDDLKKLREDVATLKNDLKTIQEQQREILKRLNELEQAQRPDTVSVKGDPFLGDRGARVAMIEYGDFECPFCGKYMREVYPQIVANYVKTGKVKYYYRDLPLSMHPHAMPAALAARCAGEQGKYWQMHDSLFADQRALTEPDLESCGQALGLDVAKLGQCIASKKYADRVHKDMSEADEMGVDGTPTFLLGTIGPGGDVVKIEKRVEGVAPYETMQSRLDELLTSKEQ